ncbi:MAG: DUF1735 and LamG domain-containing protein [Alistipes sp.]|nr:DUF1735 and LamG domain-containing protein [Alistipes sp.]
MKTTYKILLAAAALLAPWLTACERESFGDALYITGTENEEIVTFAIDGFPSSYPVTVSSTDKLEKDTYIDLRVRLDLVDEYNAKMGVNYYPIPENSFTISTTRVVIEAGSYISSSAVVEIDNDDDFVSGRVYLIPIEITDIEGDLDIIPNCRVIYLKISRTLRFYSPDIGTSSMSYQFIMPEPVTSLPVFTWEVKLLATQFVDRGSGGVTRVCAFGGDDTSQHGVVPDTDTNCDQVLIRFNEGDDPANVMKVTARGGNITSNTAFSTYQWYNIAIVNDGTTMTLYVNGERDNSSTVTATNYTLYGVQIGMPSQGYTGAQLYYGRMSEMRLWNRTLTQRELRSAICGVDPSTEGLISYWRMDEGQGNTFYDSSPVGRDIAYTNGTQINWKFDDYNKCVE